MHMLAKIYPPILTVSDCPDAKIVGCDQVANTAFTDRRVLDGFAHDIELIVTTHASSGPSLAFRRYAYMYVTYHVRQLSTHHQHMISLCAIRARTRIVAQSAHR
jgi:uncharacterized protein YbjT (DUF2867 family)